MKTLYLASFCNAALEAMGKKTNSLDDDVNGDDLRAIAEMIDIAENRKSQTLDSVKTGLWFETQKMKMK